MYMKVTELQMQCDKILDCLSSSDTSHALDTVIYSVV
jgi:hypothetical protein